MFDNLPYPSWYGGNDMQPHEERVVAEKKELDDKLAKLKTFIFGDTSFRSLASEDRNLLEDQYTVMEKYSTILEKRIARFPV